MDLFNNDELANYFINMVCFSGPLAWGGEMSGDVTTRWYVLVEITGKVVVYERFITYVH